jgi:hypothetical protein
MHVTACLRRLQVCKTVYALCRVLSLHAATAWSSLTPAWLTDPSIEDACSLAPWVK